MRALPRASPARCPATHERGDGDLRNRNATGAQRMTAPFAAAERSPRAASASVPASRGGVPAARASSAIRVMFPISLGPLRNQAISPAASRSRSKPLSVSDSARISVCSVSSVTSPGASLNQPPPMNSVMPLGNRAAISSRLRNSRSPPSASPQASPATSRHSDRAARCSSCQTYDVHRASRRSSGVDGVLLQGARPVAAHPAPVAVDFGVDFRGVPAKRIARNFAAATSAPMPASGPRPVIVRRAMTSTRVCAPSW